ncbi:glycosyltransferase family 4 protein [Nakamurella flavida]|uniref:Glycosyltransferase family 4 protein n=1 Tax=Nakamurella flavida TaxID=363630 RepID=A0A939C6U5_9ACTN|nr:glycosyltransferase family 1 protein [Nakamurella flavida]MBM9478514.1 glycosyltransferase family 4 protein [Nakamurella flavida]MDP9777659.1 glycosyltransferase involved in cell wall biosynthesis [Nakamurella flavida]
MSRAAGAHDELAVWLDGTPLLGVRTGIGRYTEHLLVALVDEPDIRPAVTAFTARGAGALAAAVPAGVRSRALPVPARLLRAAWSRAEHPAVRRFAPVARVFHATNFVLPPTGRAAGVVTVHDLAYLRMPDTVDAGSRALVDLVPRSLARAAVVCTPSQVVADQVLEAYRPLVKDIVVTPLGVTPAWSRARPPDAAARRRLGLPEDYLLFVGTREPRKDLATLLAAHALLRAEIGSAAPDLVLVGPAGWGAGQAPQPGVVVFGYLAQDDLPVVVAGARALVLPSRDEGFGLPALEALATGTAVVISDIPTLLEVTGGHAASFPVGDAAELAAVLAALPAADPTSAAARARRAFAAAFTWQRCARTTAEAYRRAAG